jgi:hypothetical protein
LNALGNFKRCRGRDQDGEAQAHEAISRDTPFCANKTENPLAARGGGALVA